jgi:predicted dehydrogenase
MIKVAIIGAGNRGYEAYAPYIIEKDDMKIVAVCDIDQERLEKIKRDLGLSDECIFSSTDEFFKKMDEKVFCDAVIIATNDKNHYETTMRVLDYPVHVLLEKPISGSEKEVRDIAEKSENMDRVFMICHVLRYAPFYRKIKELLDADEIGRIMSINHNENIGYYHFAHSFVRGNWSNAEESSPLILQKSCHDMDILLYFIGKKPRSLSAYGHLTYFKKENQPEGASSRCLDCKYQDTCVFSSKYFYTSNKGHGWRNVVTDDPSQEGLEKALREGPYGKCVYDTNNTVCDHQAISIDFENEVNVVFNLSAFSNEVHRNIKIMGTKGELIGDDASNEIKIKKFGEDSYKTYKVVSSRGHGGGDYGLMNAFYKAMKGNKEEVLSGAKESITSHLMCFAAEESRLNNKMIDFKEYIK